MSLAVTEVRRALLRFGLLTGAVALLVFLVLLLSTLSSALVRSFTGAVDGLDADVLVYSSEARDNLQASRRAPEAVEQVAAVPGVDAAAAGVTPVPPDPGPVRPARGAGDRGRTRAGLPTAQPGCAARRPCGDRRCGCTT